MSIRKLIILISCLFLGGCSTHNSNTVPSDIGKLKNLIVIAPQAKPAYQISFEKDNIYGSTKKRLIGSLGKFAVDDSGRVFIADIKQTTIDVFNSNGRYLTHIGQKGHGPGEFRAVYPIVKGNQFVVYDVRALRISIYSLTSLKLLKTINMTPADKNEVDAMSEAHLKRLYFINKDKYLVCFSNTIPMPSSMNDDRYHHLYLHYYFMNAHQHIVSTELFKLKIASVLIGKVSGTMEKIVGSSLVRVRKFSFLRKPITAVTGNDHILTNESDRFLIKVYNSRGKYEHTIYYPYKNVKLTKAAAVKSIEKNAIPKNALDFREHIALQNDLPETWPALHDIEIDDKSHLWVSTVVKDHSVYQWWVLTLNGKLIARFKWPRSKPIQVIKNGYMYTTETNKETDIKKVVRYKMKMEPAKNSEKPD